MKSVLGLGNALVDILATLSNDALLNKYSLPKGSMQHVDEVVANTVLTDLMKIGCTRISGGSAANTLNGLAKLGLNAGFVGKIGNDELGAFFADDQKASNILPKLFRSETATTGRAMVLISPDAERTFAVHLGAAIELKADDLTDEMFDGYDYFHIEGYLVQNHALIERALEIALSKGITTSLDMASYNIVDENCEFLKNMVHKYVDIVFANEDEAKSFTGKEPLDAVHEFAESCKIAVVKIGNKGSLVKSGNEFHVIPPISAKALDATGAGDLYAAGFIYGLSNNLSLDKCGAIGSLCAGNVVEVIGPKMDEIRWATIHQGIKIIVG